MKRGRALAVALLALGASMPRSGLAQSTAGEYTTIRELPDTPAGQRVREYIDLVQGRDEDAQARWLRAHLAPDLLAHGGFEDQMQRFRVIEEMGGGLQFHSVRVYAPGGAPSMPGENLVALVQYPKTGAWRALAVGVDPQPPHQVLGFMFSVARPPQDATDAVALDEQGFIEAARAAFAAQAHDNHFSGVLQVVRDGRTLVHEAAGLADLEHDVPITVATRFNTASCTKMFTAVTLLRLVERGALGLDDPIARHLPAGTVDPDAGERVTVLDLLRHTGGFDEFHIPAFYAAPRESLDTLAAIAALGAPWTPVHPLGEFHYSNAGYLLAGRIIETVTGISYQDAVAREVFAVAGMDANFDPYRRADPRHAIGYMEYPGDDGPTIVDCRRFWAGRGESAGGALCSTDDLVRFGDALFGGRLLAPRSLELLLPADEGGALGSMHFGMGVMRIGPDRKELGPVIGGTGSNEGVSAIVAYYRKVGLTIVVLSNRPGVAADVHGQIEALADRVTQWSGR